VGRRGWKRRYRGGSLESAEKEAGGVQEPSNWENFQGLIKLEVSSKIKKGLERKAGDLK